MTMANRDRRHPALDDWLTVDTDPALAARVAVEVEALPGMDLGDLRALWRKLTRTKAPEHLRPWLLRNILAYRLKARAFGDLDAATLKVLADALREARRTKRQADPVRIDRRAAPRQPRGHRPGTIFVREHNGVMYRVTQTVDGFVHEGATYASLSAVAKAITGTSWNGPRFFGLRDENAPPKTAQRVNAVR
jgi:hypothetical protein